MQQANLNRDGTYFLYHDGRVLAYPLKSASHQWGAMIHNLRTDPVFSNDPKIADGYIFSSISYLVTFPMKSVVSVLFKYPTLHADMVANFVNKAWEKIRVPRDQIRPYVQAWLIFGLFKIIVNSPQPDRFLSNRIGIDHPFFASRIQPHIMHRKILAVVLSILPGAHITKLGEARWTRVLEAIAHDKVVPDGFPEKFLTEVAIGPAAHGEILRRLQKAALDDARKPVPDPPSSTAIDLSAIQTQYNEIMAEAFGTPDDPHGRRQVYGKVYNTLTDIPAEILGDLGQPIYLKRASVSDPNQEQTLVAYVFPRRNPGMPAPSTWGDPQHAAVIVPVRPDLLARAAPVGNIAVPFSGQAKPAPGPPAVPALDLPSAALEPADDAGLREHGEHGLLPEFDQEKEEEEDPFANFADQPEDYDAWLMEINSRADDERGPAKRARTAQA